MRYVLGLVCVLVVMVASPSGARAQVEEEGTAAEPNAEEPEQSSQPTRSWLERSHPEAFIDPTKPPSEPALQLGLDSGGLQVTPAERLTPLELRIQEVDAQVFRSRAGLIGSAVVVGAGAAIIAWGVVANRNWEPSDSDSFAIDLNLGPSMAIGLGACVMLGGVVGMAVSGARMVGHKNRRREFQETQHGTAHRLQWDLQSSRLVF